MVVRHAQRPRKSSLSSSLSRMSPPFHALLFLSHPFIFSQHRSMSLIGAAYSSVHSFRLPQFIYRSRSILVKSLTASPRPTDRQTDQKGLNQKSIKWEPEPPPLLKEVSTLSIVLAPLLTIDCPVRVYDLRFQRGLDLEESSLSLILRSAKQCDPKFGFSTKSVLSSSWRSTS